MELYVCIVRSINISHNICRNPKIPCISTERWNAKMEILESVILLQTLPFDHVVALSETTQPAVGTNMLV